MWIRRRRLAAAWLLAALSAPALSAGSVAAPPRAQCGPQCGPPEVAEGGGEDGAAQDVVLLQTDLLWSERGGSDLLHDRAPPPAFVQEAAAVNGSSGDWQSAPRQQLPSEANSTAPQPAVERMEAALVEMSTLLQPGEAIVRHLELGQTRTASGEAVIGLGTFAIVCAVVLGVGGAYLFATGACNGLFAPPPSEDPKPPRRAAGHHHRGPQAVPAPQRQPRDFPAPGERPQSSPTRFAPKAVCGPTMGPAIATGGAGSSPLLADSDAQPPSAPDPPAICPSLILTNAEAKFVIPVAIFTEGGGEFDIVGSSGRMLLRGVVQAADSGEKFVSLSSPGPTANPHCRVVAAQGAGQEMQVYGRDSKPYGSLIGNPSNGGVLSYSGPPMDGAAVLAFEVGDGSNMEMFANTLDGRRFARAERKPDETWKLEVKKGADAVLICSCMLALLLLRPPPRPSILSFG